MPNRKLIEHAVRPKGVLQILQAGLEVGIQFVVHTLHAYKGHRLLISKDNLIPMSDLGYDSLLCNMVLISAAASWDGFKGNVIRTIRENGHTIRERQIDKYLKKTSSYTQIMEPLARRHCIVHNLARVDKDYKDDVPSSTLNLGDYLSINLSYLKDAFEAFFNTALELTKILVSAGLLPSEHSKAFHEFQRDPTITRIV